MKEYPKIETLFERKPDFTVDPTVIKRPVLGTINKWRCLEKIDGTNCRICLTVNEVIDQNIDNPDPPYFKDSVCVLARTDGGGLPGDLSSKLLKEFTVERIRNVFPDGEVILFGEGYGPGIQKVGNSYRKDKNFILFDVLCGTWWLEHDDVIDVANKLGCDVVPDLGLMSLDEIVELVRQPFASKIGTVMAEGVIAKPIETLLYRDGKRIIIKLKTCDFVRGHSAKVENG